MAGRKDKMADIKLFVCCHQPVEVPAHPLLVPVQAGAALADCYFPGFLHDDTGDNISSKNRSYCELTVYYWAWKNIRADYYGIFHYRRYLYPRIGAKRPYRIESKPTLSLLDKLDYCSFEDLLEQYDLIFPQGENMYLPVREHYAGARFHHRSDLELVEEIVRLRNPEMITAMETYLSGSICYFGNIAIMRRQIWDSYCSWIFQILEEFDRQADTANYSLPEQRVDGYLSERLFGVWLTFMQKDLRILELPRVHFESSLWRRQRQYLINSLLPPGTRRRAWIKRIGSG